MKKTFRYSNVYMYGSLQTVGHTEEYFARHTEKLLVYIIMPRLKSTYNLFRIYENGKRVHEEHVWSSGNIFLYYLSWYFHHIYFLLRYIKRDEPFFFIASHPLSLFGMSVQKRLRNITFGYWIGDYFPPVSLPLKLFEAVKKHYHDRVMYRCYLSDRINKKFNGRISNSRRAQTIMWGVKPLSKPRTAPKRLVRFLFVGLISEAQGLEMMLRVMQQNKQYHLTVAGLCTPALYKKHQALIKRLQIGSRVQYPNRFYSEEELIGVAQKSHIGIALYNESETSATYYTDPGKIKTYTEMGLPVLMSNTSAITPYIKKFQAGVVIPVSETSIADAVADMQKRYTTYRRGVDKFNAYFHYEQYYRKKFTFLES